MNLASIASGSSGNCIYVGNEKSHFLIDAGNQQKEDCGGTVTDGGSTRDDTGHFCDT